MEPIYRFFKDINDFYAQYGMNDNSTVEEREAREAAFRAHDHTCWLNPTGTLYAKETRKRCKKFCRKHKIPKEKGFFSDYNCDVCPNLITYIKDLDTKRPLFMVGNSYYAEKEGKFDESATADNGI